ncbi:MAG: hydantoinase/oxoprolinase family protein [Candidatus Altiarchaeota archaeon]|nr:hydantoinase/oxoprolinase family protein [Candidatus Altiarchaeota archaeon]
MRVLGLDIGGANIKTAFLGVDGLIQGSCYFPIWKRKNELRLFLGKVVKEFKPEKVALSMTAELSDAFSNKQEGVNFILDSLEGCFEGRILVLSTQGLFIPPHEAREDYMKVASANWVAISQYAAKRYGSGMLVDVGSTTTDIIPFKNGLIASEGRTDLKRLQSCELVYSGALRTNLATIADSVPVRGMQTRVSSEFFASTADIYRILGDIKEKDYICDTPDGRDKSIKECMARIARIVCADTLMLDDENIVDIAQHLRDKQLDLIGGCIENTAGRWGLNKAFTCGSGSFIAQKAARKSGFEIQQLEMNTASAMLALLRE